MIDVVVAQRIEGAKAPEDFFGPLSPPESAMRDAVALAYRRVVVIVHPDKHAGTAHELIAKDLFRRVTTLKDQALRKIAAGTYGQKDVAPPEDRPKAPVRVAVGKTQYVLEDLLYHGDLADLYGCSWDEGKARGLFKIARNAADNDLLENEAQVLGKLGMTEHLTGMAYKFFPRLYGSFPIREKGGVARRALVIGHYPGHLSLSEICDAFPEGVDFRDVAWMWKRMLHAAGHAHQKGIVHGGITPDHVLVHPIEHGAKLLDWTAATTVGGTVKVVSKKWRTRYPPEVLAKRPATAATDIYMISACVMLLLAGSSARHVVPEPLQDFLQSCLILAQGRRPDDAWQLHEELDELLRRLVGKRSYREFKMPAGRS